MKTNSNVYSILKKINFYKKNIGKTLFIKKVSIVVD